ncbi:Spliceosome-associated protein CWC27-like [Holothuria leucospilota]|uniref:Spliceosome-associated protein CWC27 homolog n=1 Tax=Holothuria leucospilota TaxID=206669 RepID=A0A9Q1C9N1_HOLLE|nr:Spliceosome-associated protein CWC27-like [Holothuria leucospilota]
MSNIYIQEPPSQGKVLLHTTVGDIDIELWSKEAPKACRNFIQLCLEGYYNETIFHRIIRGFMAQGGDPTGTGEGGESIYGATFKDEFHSRLKFIRRGLVAMANAGPNDNGSQFFITLDKCEHLNGKHTIFGKVTGQTIYNVLKFGDIEVDGDDRPVYPPKIKSTEVLSNPFDDIKPRVTSKKEDTSVEKKKKSKSKATKNFSLLSFGEEAEEEEADAETATADFRQKSKSAHDLSHDPTLLPDVGDGFDNSQNSPPKIVEESPRIEEEDGAKNRIKEKLKKEKSSKVEPDIKDEKMSSRTEELKKESDQLMKELVKGKRKHEAEKEKAEKLDISDFKAEKKLFQKRKKLSKGSNREDETLKLLARFQNKLQEASSKFDDSDDKEMKQREDDARSKEDGKKKEDEDNNDDVAGDDWLAHKLHFDTKSSLVKDANVITADTYDIYDPRNPMNKRKRESGKQKSKNKR